MKQALSFDIKCLLRGSMFWSALKRPPVPRFCVYIHIPLLLPFTRATISVFEIVRLSPLSSLISIVSPLMLVTSPAPLLVITLSLSVMSPP